MSRAPRVQAPGFPHHIVARGNRGAPIYLDKADRRRFLRLLDSTLESYGLTCEAFCLMTTHYHLVVTPTEETLGDALRRLNGLYSRTFNRRYGLRGHLFENRYRSVLIETESQFISVVRYLALNPLRAGICLDPREWEWSTYAALAGDAPAPNYVSFERTLTAFDRNPSAARRQLEGFVAEGIAADRQARELAVAKLS